MPIKSYHLTFYFLCSILLSCSTSPIMTAPESEEIIVTGIRASLKEGEALHRMVDNDVEDIGQEQEERVVKTWRESGEQANAAVLDVGYDETIAPEAIDIKVQVDGFRARVVVDGFYRNPHQQRLEGDFKFRLPDGAKPYYFAYGEALSLSGNLLAGDVRLSREQQLKGHLDPISLKKSRQGGWKDPKEAVMVARQKAAFAYEDTVSQQIDPALMEWSGAGIFSASVFPLNPNSLSRIVIGYDIDLTRLDNHLYLDLPLTSKEINKRIHIAFGNVDRNAVKLQRVIDKELKTPFTPKVLNGILQETLQGEILQGIRIEIHTEQSPLLVGMDEVGDYFATQWVADLPEAKANNTSRGVFILDTSLSASPDKFHLWVALLLETLTQNEATLNEFALASFNTDVVWWKHVFVANTQDNREALKAYLYSLILEGATDLSSALVSASNIPWLQQQHLSYDIFLFSDGAATWGERNAWVTTEKIKAHFAGNIYSYRLGMEGEEKEYLEHLAREIGGASFHLQDKSEILQLAKAHTALPWSLENIEFTGAEDILLEGRPSVIYPGQVLTVVGRKVGELGNAIRFSLKNSDHAIVIDIPVKHTLASTLTARTFGQIAVAQLETLGDLKAKVAAAYANHFKVPGQASSLLMLESKQDYERYNIAPQQDAYIVKTMPIHAVFASLSENIAELLSDPKHAFVKRVEDLSKADGVNMELPNAVALLMETMPTEAFAKPIYNSGTKTIFQAQTKKRYISGLSQENIYELVVDEAENRFNKFGAADAIKVMSNLVERAPADVAVLRDVAYASEVWGQPMVAFDLHERAMDMRPFEPQSYNYLAKLSEKIGMYDLAVLYFEMGLGGSWADRFEDYTTIHKMDYLSFLRRHSDGEKEFFSQDYARLRLSQLKKEFTDSIDLLVAISWNTDRTDVDLHVVEPSGEECYYKHALTKSEGMLSGDVTEGYGPEFYQNKNAPEGKYHIYVKYFSDDQNKLGLKTKVNVRVIRHWGTKEETQTSKNIALQSAREKQLVFETKMDRKI